MRGLFRQEATLAVLWITGFQGLGYDQRGSIVQAPLEPSVAALTVSFTTAAAAAVQLLGASGTINALYYELTCTSPYHMKLGTASTVSATATVCRVPADTIKYIGVDRGGLWVSALTAV